MMRDLLLGPLAEILEQGLPCVVCSLVETRGSTPQKAGAAMVVFPDGGQAGTLGGGCVEAEVKHQALRLLEEGAARLLTFHLDDNYGWDDGLICGGRMTVLAQPLLPSRESGATAAREYFHRFRQAVAAGGGCFEAVLLEPCGADPAGARVLLGASGEAVAHLGGGPPSPEILARLKPMLDRPRPWTHSGVAYLPVPPRITLLIVGGGHVGQAVGRLAAEADFDIWVLDDREQYASAERFPAARRRLVGPIGDTLKELKAGINPATYCIIVTRGHAHDEEALYHLAGTSAGYLGMIGSKRKIRLIYDDLMAKGIPAAALERVHAPLGLDIGSQTVPEIAISIVAELIAFRNQGSARRRTSPGQA